MIIDLCVLGLVAGMTYALVSEGLWGAALMFFNSLFAALITFNFYEPLAQLIVTNVGSETVSSFADSLSMMLIFIVSLVIFRLTTESLAPALVRFPKALYYLGGFVFGLGASAITVAILLLAFQASPVQKKMLGVWDYKHKVFNMDQFGRFDRDFLALFQYTTGYTFPRNGAGEPDKEFPGSKPMLFDPRGEWLMVHQLARPYGTEAILEEAPADPAAATPGGAPAGGEAQPGGQQQQQQQQQGRGNMGRGRGPMPGAPPQ